MDAMTSEAMSMQARHNDLFGGGPWGAPEPARGPRPTRTPKDQRGTRVVPRRRPARAVQRPPRLQPGARQGNNYRQRVCPVCGAVAYTSAVNAIPGPVVSCNFCRAQIAEFR